MKTQQCGMEQEAAHVYCISMRFWAEPVDATEKEQQHNGEGTACHYHLRQGGCIQSSEPLVFLDLLWFASISLGRLFFDPPFLLPLLLPPSMSSQDRFPLPAWYPFAALPLGGQALLLAELDADAPALPASNCCCFHFSFRVLRAIC